MRLLRRTPLVSAALAISLLATGTSAQGAAATDLPDLSTATQTNRRPSTNPLTSAVTNTNTNINTNTNTNPGTTIALTGTTTTAAVPKLTSSVTSNSGLPSLPTNLPTLTGIATIVTPVVPNTKQAPFMQQSSMPDGTVFIVVGAILGFMAMSVLLWRALIAWSLHRSVKRAALAQHTAMNDTKTLFRPGPAQPQFYKYSDRESTISLGGMGKSGKKAPKHTSTAGLSGGQSTANLFFSPTAGAATSGLTAGSRGSNYLPAGYYAPAAAQAGAGQSHIPLGHHTSASLSTFSHPRASRMGETPPESPAYGHSSSTLDLRSGYAERAPSAFLDDLFDGENGPPVPGHGTRHGHRRGNSVPIQRY